MLEELLEEVEGDFVEWTIQRSNHMTKKIADALTNKPRAIMKVRYGAISTTTIGLK